MCKTNKVPFALWPMSVDEQLQHLWNEQSCKCPNLDKDLQFISTWWGEELKLALQERYHEMWDFEPCESREYNHQRQSTN